MTCYNHENTLRNACAVSLGKLIKNRTLNFNDGSTDASGEVISEVLQDSPFTETHYFQKKIEVWPTSEMML